LLSDNTFGLQFCFWAAFSSNKIEVGNVYVVMNGTIKVMGGNKLQGSVVPIANKNSLVAVLPACILSDETIIYRNVPESTDVVKILEMLRLLGAGVDDSDFGNLKINCKNISSYRVDPVLGGQIRASILFVGPLLARFGRAEVPLPGGCVLGKRAISAHIDAFQKAGVKVEIKDGFAEFTAPERLSKEYRIWQVEASVTSTENVSMYAAGISSEVTVIDAASEPHVCDLVAMLENMGARIEGSGSNRLKITGRSKLGPAVFNPRPDFVDIAGYIVASAITNGDILIKGGNIPDVVDGLLLWFEKFNVEVLRRGKDLIARGFYKNSAGIVDRGFPLAGDSLPKFVPRPWPGFPVDVLPVIAILACKSYGRVLLQNWMYESGLEFVKDLNDMGANIFICDPQRVIVEGPIKFKGGEVFSPGVIQACMAIFLASLADPVVTTIHGIDILKRRNPHLFDIYKDLGANIEILS